METFGAWRQRGHSGSATRRGWSLARRGRRTTCVRPSGRVGYRGTLWCALDPTPGQSRPHPHARLSRRDGPGAEHAPVTVRLPSQQCNRGGARASALPLSEVGRVHVCEWTIVARIVAHEAMQPAEERREMLRRASALVVHATRVGEVQRLCGCGPSEAGTEAHHRERGREHLTQNKRERAHKANGQGVWGLRTAPTLRRICESDVFATAILRQVM